MWEVLLTSVDSYQQDLYTSSEMPQMHLPTMPLVMLWCLVTSVLVFTELF